MAGSRIHLSQRGAVAARTLLAMFVVFGLVVFFLPTSPLGSTGAQAQTTPTPTPTGARIQFLNPSGATANSGISGPGREISTNSDTSDTAYHLVAWVGSVPANASVDFKYYNTDGTGETSIGTGTLRGTDTYDILWTSLPSTDGSYDVRATLYSGGTAVSTDTERIVVNNQDATRQAMVPTGEDRGETVEITYPQQAGQFGAYRKPGTSGPYFGIVDVATSDGADAVRTYYTTTAPGSEPSWVRCSSPDTGETVANSANGVRCTLASGVNPASVTAIAAATGDANQSVSAGTCTPSAPNAPSNCGEGEDSGDAHRATGYSQTPNSVTISPATQQKDDEAAEGVQFPCSDVITATVLDQVGRKVAGANVDVHAAGPSDNLYFDDTGNNSTAHQPPNSAGHTTEATVDCESTTQPRPFNSTSGEGQGEHEVSGEGDIKHIETQAAGTDDAGQMKFQLHNRSTLTGSTQFTAFYDADDDDVRCSSEPAGHGSIGWGAAPASPTGVAATTSTCTTPTSSPSASTTSSASATASSSSSASPTSSASPGTARTTGLSASEAKVESGATVTFTGQVISSDESCEDNEFVRIQRRVHGTDSFENFRSLNTDSEGQFEASVEANVSADYRAFAAAHDNCADSTSQEVTVLAKVKVSITVDDFRPERGTNVRITGKVEPNHDGNKVVLQRKKGGRWVKVKRDTLDAGSRYAFRIPADWRRSRLFRVKWIQGDEDHEVGKSQKVKITTHR